MLDRWGDKPQNPTHPDARVQHRHLLLPPPQHVPEERGREALDALDKVVAHERAALLQSRILGPAADRQLKALLMDVFEPNVERPLLHGWRGVHGPTDLVARLHEPVHHGEHRVVGLERTVFGEERVGRLLEFDPAARFEILVDLPHEAGPVLDGASHVPAMNVVVRLWLDPVELDVVDVELDVGRDPFRLGGTEVVADNELGAGVEVAEMDGPDARAGAN
ncbi:hypothetical protein BN1708_001588, partial [Verticillium longisporum]